MAEPLHDSALDQLFRNARSYNGWLDKDVTDEQIRAIYELMKMGPLGQPAAGADCLVQVARSQAAAGAVRLAGQPAQDHDGPGLRDHRHGPRIP